MITTALKKRRSCYSLSDKSTLSDSAIEQIMKEVILHVPSAFNSQSTRIVLLLGNDHRKLWSITKEALRKVVPAKSFMASEQKIDACFLAGYGTVLFYENQDVVKSLQEQFVTYKDYFPSWSQHTSAMHQFAVWMQLEEAGMGASLQHYSPLIDIEVAATWKIDSAWKMIAQMPFGVVKQAPAQKTFLSVNDRIKVFNS